MPTLHRSTTISDRPKRPKRFVVALKRCTLARRRTAGPGVAHRVQWVSPSHRRAQQPPALCPGKRVVYYCPALTDSHFLLLAPHPFDIINSGTARPGWDFFFLPGMSAFFGLRMITVLLIEDNDVDARLTQDLLAEWSVEEFKVTHARTLSDGLAHIDKAPFDAILLDLSLPDAFGLPTVRQVHATNPSIPVVVLSGVSDQSLALQAVQQGAQDYLVKGQGHPELLARSVRYAIERKRAEEHLTYRE